MKTIKVLAIAAIFAAGPAHAGGKTVSLEHQEHGHVWGRCGHCGKY